MELLHGVRWHVMKHIAAWLKADQRRPVPGMAGHFVKARPGLGGSNVRLPGLAVNFVFLRGVMFMHKNIHAVIIAAGLVLLSPCAWAEAVVIVSARSAATALTEEQASDIFLGKINALPGGGMAVPVDQSEGSAVRSQFYTKVSSKTSAQMKAYWSKQIFSGRARRPRRLATARPSRPWWRPIRTSSATSTGTPSTRP